MSCILNDGGTCSDTGAPDGGGLVWSLEGHGKDGGLCLRVLTTGRFVRCLEGDPHGCTLTTDCTPPPTGLGVRAQDAGADGWSFENVACLPPMGVPMSWTVTLELPAGKLWYGLVQDTNAVDAESCFLDVYDVATQVVDCSAP